jgi:SAM-dependent methyltransferase
LVPPETNWARTGRRVEPDAARHVRYQELFATYAALYSAAKEHMQTLARDPGVRRRRVADGAGYGRAVPELPRHASHNRNYWDEQAPGWVLSGEQRWASTEPVWGVWKLPETEVGLFPADLAGLDAIELGCGTGYVSGWMARRGARVVGIDNSERQLTTARRLAAEHGVELTLLHGNAETVDYPDESFDFAVSEYGAAIWCDPHAWVPEAYRLLRPGGRLAFLGHTPLSMVCSPTDGSLPIEVRLHRPYFGLHSLDWTDAVDDPGGIEFNLGTADWFALFRRTGFEIVDYLELRNPDPQRPDHDWVTAQWAHDFPSEQVWKLRKPGP